MAAQRQLLKRATRLSRGFGRHFSALSSSSSSKVADYAQVPVLPAFDHDPRPYNGPRVDEVFQKRKTFLGPSLFHYYLKPSVLLMESSKLSSSEFYAHQLHQSLKSGDFHAAASIHTRILKCGLNTSAYLMNNLLNFYAKMGSLSDAHSVFDEIPVRTTHCWNTLLSGYAKRGRFEEALTIFRAIPERDSVSWTTMIVGYNRSNKFDKAIKMFVRMISERVRISEFTATSILASCAAAGALSIGRKAHSFVVKTGLNGNATVANSLLNMYAKTGDPSKACAVFDGMRTRNVSSWNCMVSSLMQSGEFRAAISLFDAMEERNVVSWNTVIAGYNQRGYDAEALQFLAKMLKDSSLRPDRFTLTSALSACANTGKLQLGRQIHGCIMTAEIEASTAMGNSLVSMYAKCGKVDIARQILVQSGASRLNMVAFTALLDGYIKLGDVNPAREIFDSLKDRDVVAWTAMIVGYTGNGLSDKALSLFRLMMTEGPKPNKFTFAAVLSAAAALACLDHGKQVHAHAMRSGEALSVSVSNALITMYSKTGSINAAKRVFERSSSTRDTVTWTSMILALAQHGLGEEAIKLFDTMLACSIAPDHVTYVAVLSACTHMGLVEKGRIYYNTMINTHKIKPSLSHYSCMIDLLARAGRLTEAFEFVYAMPTEPDAAAWGSLLSACKLHRDAELASIAAERLLAADPSNSGAYATLANAYSACGKWEVSANVRKLMRDRGVKKERGLSWIRVQNVAHVFGAEDTSHPQKQAIYARVERLWREIKEMGFTPDLESVLHDLEDEAKEEILRHHSEKLAIAFGLMNTPEGATLRVMKNLRVCGDCHSAIKFISKLERREIILRDATRFHHFKDGLCSCKDYW